MDSSKRLAEAKDLIVELDRIAPHLRKVVLNWDFISLKLGIYVLN